MPERFPSPGNARAARPAPSPMGRPGTPYRSEFGGSRLVRFAAVSSPAHEPRLEGAALFQDAAPIFCLDHVSRVSPFHRLILSHVESEAR